MSERRCRESILEQLDRDPPAETLAEMARHARACPRCRDLLPLIEADETAPVPPVPDELLASVLERTSGAGCGEAEVLVASREVEPEEVGAALLRDHLASCPGCRALSSCISRLERELPDLADIDPGPRFTAEVISRTSDRRGTRPARGALDRLIGWVRRGWQRPRLALEAGYLGALMLWVTVGIPDVGALGRAPRILERSAGSTIGEVTRLTEARSETAGRAVASFLEAARASGASRWRDLGHELGRRFDRTEPSRRSIAVAGSSLGEAIAEADFLQAGRRAGELFSGTIRLPGQFLGEPAPERRLPRTQRDLTHEGDDR